MSAQLQWSFGPEDQETAQKIEVLIENYKALLKSSYPDESLDFDMLNLTKRVTQVQGTIGHGRYSDIYRGVLDDELPVAVKMLRLHSSALYQDEFYNAMVLRFFREVNHWNKLKHVNIAQMLGIVLLPGRVGLVAILYPNGNLLEHLRSGINPSKQDLMLDVAEGLEYLHSLPNTVIHADLKALNVFVNGDGIACIGDFGLSKQVADQSRKTGFETSGRAGTTAWMAPELLTEVGGVKFTTASDIYACACVFLETQCPGKPPFYWILNHDPSVILAKVKGEVPDRQKYPEITDDVFWDLLVRCWAKNFLKRPIIQEVVRTLYSQFKLSPRVSHVIAERPRLEQASISASWPNLPIVETEESKHTREQSLFNELIREEERYLQNLERADGAIVQSLRRQRPQIIPADEIEEFINAVFGTVLQFREPGRTFLQVMHLGRGGRKRVIQQVGDVLLDASQQFLNTYLAYLDQLPQAQNMLSREMSTNSRFCEFLENLPDDLLEEELDAPNFIHLPSRHLARYRRLATNMLANTDPSHPEYEDIRKASLLLSRAFGITRLKLWQNAMIPEPNGYDEWRASIDPNPIPYQLSATELQEQELIFEMVRQEMAFVSDFDLIRTKYIQALNQHSQQGPLILPAAELGIFIKDVFDKLISIHEDHCNLISQLHAVQRGSYPLVHLRSVLMELLRYVSNWKSMYNNYAHEYPAGLQRVKSMLAHNREFRKFHEGRMNEFFFPRTVHNTIDFFELLMPILRWYQLSFFPSLVQAATLEREDQDLLHLVKSEFDVLFLDFESQTSLQTSVTDIRSHLPSYTSTLISEIADNSQTIHLRLRDIRVRKHACRALGDYCLQIGQVLASLTFSEQSGLSPADLNTVGSIGRIFDSIDDNSKRWKAFNIWQDLLYNYDVQRFVDLTRNRLAECLGQLRWLDRVHQRQWEVHFVHIGELDHSSILATKVRQDQVERTTKDLQKRLSSLQEGTVQRSSAAEAQWIKDRPYEVRTQPPDESRQDRVGRTTKDLQARLSQVQDGTIRRSNAAEAQWIKDRLYEMRTQPPDESDTTNVLLYRELTRNEVRRTGSRPLHVGDTYDIWQGRLYEKENVVLKIFRGALPSSDGSQQLNINDGQNQDNERRWSRQVDIWRLLRHENVLRLFGVVILPPSPSASAQKKAEVALVAPLMKNRDAARYFSYKNEATKNADRMKFVIGIGRGLKYLHSLGIVHGGLQGSKVLVSDDGSAVLSDFSVSKLMSDNPLFTGNQGATQAIRWLAPEASENQVLTAQADVYSWGMTALQVLSGREPFYKMRTVGSLIIAFRDQEIKPDRNDYTQDQIGNNMWDLLSACWSHDPRDRPTIDTILKALEAIVRDMQETVEE